MIKELANCHLKNAGKFVATTSLGHKYSEETQKEKLFVSRMISSSSIHKQQQSELIGLSKEDDDKFQIRTLFTVSSEILGCSLPEGNAEWQKSSLASSSLNSLSLYSQ